MERGRAWSSGTAVAALTGVVLTGGATFGAAVAEAAPVVPHAPVPPVCTIAATTYLQPPVRPGAAATSRPAVLADAAGRCVDAISKDLLVPSDVLGHALVRVPAAKPRPRPAPVTTTTAPKPAPATTTPVTTTPVTTTPATSTVTTPAGTGGVVPSAPATPATPPAPAGGAVSGVTPATPAAPGATPVVPVAVPASSAPSATTTAPRPNALRRSAVPAAVLGNSAPTAPAAPATPPAAGPGVTTANPLAAAPLSALAPGDAAAVPAVEPASYLDPLGAPGIGALPGEPAILQTLGGDTAGVTTSSRVQALGLDALHRGAGVPAVVGVTIMAGLGGFALRHRILHRIRRDAPAAGGPDPAEDHAPEEAFAAGRHAR